MANRLRPGEADPELAAHPEVRDHGVTVVERPPEVLAAAPNGGDGVAAQHGLEVRGATFVPADGAVVEDLDVGDSTADQMRAEPAADDLDLR